MFYTIYKTTNTVNNKIYIGMHKTKKLDDGYLGSGKDLQVDIGKHGIELFEKEILYIFDNEKDMREMEKETVDEEFVSRKDTYNLNLGGTGSWHHANKNGNNNKSNQYLIVSQKIKDDPIYAKEFSDKISKSLVETWKIKEHPWIGKRHTEETKKKIGKINSKHQQGKGNSCYGRCWIYNEELQESRSIKKEELEQWLSDGWIKGRKQIFKN